MDNITNWHPLYQEISAVIGREATQKLQRIFGGSQINLPKRLLDPKKEAHLIWQEHQTGQSIAHLARRHHYSTRNIRRILAKQTAYQRDST